MPSEQMSAVQAAEAHASAESAERHDATTFLGAHLPHPGAATYESSSEVTAYSAPRSMVGWCCGDLNSMQLELVMLVGLTPSFIMVLLGSS
eukprot:scaffold55592_cov68-Phaeocystis_antarctica.AAC.2